MTELVQSTRAAEDSERSDVSGAQPAPMAVADSRLGASRRGVWWFACGVAGTLAIVWFIIFSRGEIGSKAEWFFGAVVFCVVMVTMWQTLNIQRQANQNAAEAAERLRTELAAAEERAARELAMTQALHRVEMEAQEKLHPRRGGGSTGAGSCRARPPDQSAAEAGDDRGVARGQRAHSNARRHCGTRARASCASRTATSASTR